MPLVFRDNVCTPMFAVDEIHVEYTPHFEHGCGTRRNAPMTVGCCVTNCQVCLRLDQPDLTAHSSRSVDEDASNEIPSYAFGVVQEE